MTIKEKAGKWKQNYASTFIIGHSQLSRDANDIISQLLSENEKLEEELEKERMRLAACGVAAMCNTEQLIKEQRITSDNQDYSASYKEVCDVVDREINLRTDLATVRADTIEKVEEIIKGTPYRGDSEHDDALTSFEREIIDAVRGME